MDITVAMKVFWRAKVFWKGKSGIQVLFDNSRPQNCYYGDTYNFNQLNVNYPCLGFILRKPENRAFSVAFK